MSGSPAWKVYRPGASRPEYVAACKYPEDAAALVALSGEGTVKHGHGLTVWREGREAFPASESYDGAAALMRKRLQRKLEANYVKAHGKLPADYRCSA